MLYVIFLFLIHLIFSRANVFQVVIFKLEGPLCVLYDVAKDSKRPMANKGLFYETVRWKVQFDPNENKIPYYEQMENMNIRRMT